MCMPDAADHGLQLPCAQIGQHPCSSCSPALVHQMLASQGSARHPCHAACAASLIACGVLRLPGEGVSQHLRMVVLHVSEQGVSVANAVYTSYLDKVHCS